MKNINKALYLAFAFLLLALPVNAHAQTCSPEDRTCPSGMWCNVESRYTGNCVAKLPDGTPCNGSFQCASDSCAASPSGTFTCGGVNPPGTNEPGTTSNLPTCPADNYGSTPNNNCPNGGASQACTISGTTMTAYYCTPGNGGGSCVGPNGNMPYGTPCSPNVVNGGPGYCGDEDGICQVPEMSDYLAVAFVIVTGGAVYYMRRRKMKSPQ